MAQVQTVQGPVDAGELGTVLIHEHVRFRDEAVAANWPSRYDAGAELAAALEAVGAARDRGVRTIVDPTAMFGGRDVRFMARVAEQTGVQIVACTGIDTYDYLPHYFENRSEDQIADMFVEDIETGIQGSELKAAFLKCAADAHGVTEHVEKVHRAVARETPDRRADHGPLAPGVEHRPAPDRDLPRGGRRPREDPDRPHGRQRRPRLHRGAPRRRRLDRPRSLRPRPLPAVREAQRHHRRAAAPRPRRPHLPLPGPLRDDRLVPAGSGRRADRPGARPRLVDDAGLRPGAPMAATAGRLGRRGLHHRVRGEPPPLAGRVLARPYAASGTSPRRRAADAACTRSVTTSASGSAAMSGQPMISSAQPQSQTTVPGPRGAP